MMSSEHDWVEGSEQYQWLEQDLKAVDRSITPWIVVTAHRMMYSTQLCEESDYNVSLVFRKHVEPLLLQFAVDAVMVGHQHSYERTCKVRNGTCVKVGEQGEAAQHGVVHITAGSAGAGVEKCGFDITGKHGNFSVVHSNQWGYLRGHATMHNFTIEFVSDALGTAFDQVFFEK